MSRTRRRTALVASLLAGAMLAGCGGSDDSGGGEQASGEPQAGGSLTVSAINEPANLDPASLSNSYATQGVWGNALYGTLMELNTDGEVEYKMLEDLENRDNTTWVATLREGLTFSDGTPLDAEALRYNWQRDADRSIAHPQTVASAATIASMTVVDDRTLEVTLKQPTAHFESLVMAMNFVGSPTALAAGPEAFTANPVGAGPFVLDSWARQDRMVLKKNPDYWDAPKPYLDELIIRPNLEDSARYTALQAGETDMFISNNFETAELAGNSGNDVMPADFSGLTNLEFNFSKAPFDDPRAREAIVLAVDREELDDTLYGGAGEVPDSLLRDSSPLYDGSVTFPDADPERAQELLDELAADGKPLSFTILSSTNSDARQAGEAIQAQLQSFDNLDVQVESMESASWFGRLGQNDYDATIYGAAFVDPSPVLDTLVGTGSPTNFMKISDPELDAALEQGRLAADTDVRREAYTTVMRIVVDTNAMIGYTRTPAFLVLTDRVGGASMYNAGSPTVDGLWIDQDA